MDKIFIRKLKANTIIGTLPEERIHRQDIVLDLELSLSLCEAGRSDDLNLTANYSQIERQTLEFVEKSDYLLLETLAENLASLILDNHPIDQIKIAISKEQASRYRAEIGIEIVRNR